MKKTILLFAISCICQFAVAQTKKELIIELFKVMKQDSLMELMGKSMAKTIYMQNQMIKKSLNQKGELPQKIDVSVDNLEMMVMANKIADTSIKYMKKFVADDLANIYEKHYSETEIRDFIQFYKSSSGQKMLLETPIVQTETMQIMMQKYMPEMSREMEEMLKEKFEKEQKNEK